MLTTAAALRGATKHYKTFALGPVDLAVPSGSILGLIGENGAGKTTALKLLCGAIRPDGGSVELLGGSPADPAGTLQNLTRWCVVLSWTAAKRSKSTAVACG